MDDTLFRTQTNVHVIKDNKIVKTLSSHEFAVYKLEDGESFDYREFRCGKSFAATAKPVENAFKIAKKIFQNLSHQDHVIVTARSELHYLDDFMSVFHKHTFKIDLDDIHFAGDREIADNCTPQEAKKRVFRDLINSAPYKVVRTFDDSMKNINVFLELREEFPDISFEAFFVHKDGTIERL